MLCSWYPLRLGCIGKSAAASGVNLQLSAAIWVGFAKMRGLAMDGNCKTFDTSADGFARGEGMGSVYLKPAAPEAFSVALLGGVATNHDGRAATITAPNGTAQQRVLRAALAERGTLPEAVSCLECHGTGTALGDPIEVGGQSAVYGKSRGSFLLAAGKTNLGHLEGAAGVAGISKAVLSCQRAQVPALLWLRQLNNNIELSGFSAAMPTELLAWRREKKISSVSSFGFSGTNGHALVEEAEVSAPPPRAKYARRMLQAYHMWMQDFSFQEVLIPVELSTMDSGHADTIVIGDGPIFSAASSWATAKVQGYLGPAELADMLKGKTAVFICDKSAEVPGLALVHLINFFKALHESNAHMAIVVISNPQESCFQSTGAFWGLARSARLELQTTIKILECDKAQVVGGLNAICASQELEIVGSSQAPRLQRYDAAALQNRDALQVNLGTALLTGGLGGLGLVAAQELVELGASRLILTSRSGSSKSSVRLARLESVPSVVIQVNKLDAGCAEDVASMAEALGPASVDLLVHAAGVLDRCPLAELTADRLSVTTRPKANAAWYLHQAFHGLKGSVLFSSVSAFLGLSGGAAYAAANGYLDSFAVWRQQGTFSLRLGPVAEVGMSAASADAMKAMPLKALSLAQVSSALRVILAPPLGKIGLSELTLAKADWAMYFKDSSGLAPALKDFQEFENISRTVEARRSSPFASLSQEDREMHVLKVIRDAAKSMHMDIQDDTPLMEAGIDSLSAVEFRGKIANEFRSVRLPSTLMFDHPTLKATAVYIAGALAEEHHTQSGQRTELAKLPVTDEVPIRGGVYVRGAACNLPSCQFLDFSCSLWQGTDAVSEMPYSRWDTDEYYDPAVPTGLEMYVCHAAFIANVELFDAQLFGISKAEADAMDPQQRHLLETSFAAFTDAGLPKATLMGKPGGVFVGQDKCDWNRMISAAHAGPFAATGGSASISANRISYSLGLKGPSATMDTACSSSLVAADTAAVNLRRGRCEFAAVCGVNMLLLPQTFIGCCQARMLSFDGRCHTFDSSACGYARGEGTGAQVLQQVANQVSEASLASFLGSALNQDGRSANLTSPNGPSQEVVVRIALQEAGCDAGDLFQVETHGTGTELGDPIETGALRSVLAARSSPLCLGAVKTNVGHLEGAAGMAGLSKLVSQLSKLTFGSAPNLHLRQLNQHISEDCKEFAAIFITSATASAKAKVRATASSVSSFGFGGTNGHVVLSCPEMKAAPAFARPHVHFQGRQAFLWREPAHPLVRQKIKGEDGVCILSCPIDGHVLQLLSHHIVHGEVVVPGACYLEMILAGLRTHLGPQEAWCIENLGFAKPLVLRLSQDGRLEEPVQLRLLIWPDGRLEVESEVGDDESITTHVEANWIQLQGGWQNNQIEKDKHDLAKLREECPEDVDIELMYSFGVKSGLPLQPRFRCVRQVQVQKKEPSGLARLEMERDGTQTGFLLGPSVIDSSFQALMALADPDVGIGSLKIPLSIKRLQPTGRAYSIGIWSHFQLLDWTPHSTVFRSWMVNDAGESVLYFDSVHLQEVRDEHLQKVLQASGRLGAEQQALYSSNWRQMSFDPVALPRSAYAGWLILGRSQDIRKSGLKEAGCLCITCTAHGHEEAEQGAGHDHGDSCNYQDESALETILRKAKLVIFVGGLAQGDSTNCQKHGTEDVDVLVLALHLCRAASRTSTRLFFVTCGGSEPIHGGLWGFARTVRLEESTIQLTCVHVDAEANLLEALEAATAALDAKLEEELSYQKAGEAWTLSCSRLSRSTLSVRAPIRLNMPFRGALTGLKPVPQTRQPVVLGSVQLRIRAVGLNFRDVLNVMGLYPGDPGPPGADCAGTVLDVGERVDHLRIAEDVFGEAPGCLSTYCVAPSSLLTQKPPSWSFEEACTMPVIFVTVEEALGDLARLKCGERVLIHAAAGGVGLVAIQYAKYVGAEVFATAGAEEKHQYLRSLGVKYITSSRNGSKFEEDMTNFLAKDGAAGVDVVLNSLSHDDYISRSLACLKSGGRFIEIGKRGIWSHKQMWDVRPDVMYEKIAADTMMEKESWRYNAYLKRLLMRVEAGALSPINMHVFQGLEEGVHALQFLQRAQNIGKVVISEPSKICQDAGGLGMHLLSGGTGALGIVTAQFLAEEGTKNLCLLSRSGRVPAEVQTRWDWLQASCVQVVIKRGDVSEEHAVKMLSKDLGKSGPCMSLLHLAGALADAMLPALDRELFQKSYGPKIHGLRHILRHVDFKDSASFVLFSSTSSLFGAPGQGNYAAANSTLDAFAPYWSARGSPTIAVQWGPWAEAGMAVQKGTVQRAKASGIGSLSNSQGMAILGSVIYQKVLPPVHVIGAAHIQWPKFLRTAFNAGVPGFLQDLEAEAAKTTDGPREGEWVAALSSMGAAERLEAIQQRVKRLAEDVVGDELSADDPLLESGMDSLSGVEFRNRLQQEFGGIRLPNSAVFDYPTANALAGFIAHQFGDKPQEEAEPQPVSEGIPATSSILERLNDRTTGQPIFLVPGAALQAAGFQNLAALLPMPAFGVSWPSSPRERWPSTLTALASMILEEVRAVSAAPYYFAGHSFGASLCLEMARLVEAAGEGVASIILLDPRSLLPVEDPGEVLLQAGLVETVALLSKTVADGAHYASLVEELQEQDAAAQTATFKRLGAAAVATLEHVHQTFHWYATLLSDACETAHLRARVHWFRAEEAWLTDVPNEAASARIVRNVQAQVFQRDANVAERLRAWSAESVQVLAVSGDHFSMLLEPHVANTAMRICYAMVEADVLEGDSQSPAQNRADQAVMTAQSNSSGHSESTLTSLASLHQSLEQEEYRWHLLAYRFGQVRDY
ncbi:unnamed protein product [Durusdinium trenchii]|uniref:Uncharacterized protein n=1 Tax=Durusdinium trenchii TaxID=1381693 RepID=A0ABP0RSQ4_9DINO